MTQNAVPDTPFAVVQWLDAWADAHDSASASDVGLKHKSVAMRTAGWLLADNEAGVSLFSEFCSEDETYRSRTFIPRAMIVSVAVVRLVKPRTPKP